MTWKKWICGVLLLGAPVLLLTQCTSTGSQPTAPAVKSATVGSCTAECRTLEVLSPPPVGPVCAGQCTRMTWRVLNPCGDFITYVEGWYDGAWVDLGSVTNQTWIHWDSPGGPHAPLPATSSVRLRLIVVDGLGLVGSQELNLSPILPARPPMRPRGEFD